MTCPDAGKVRQGLDARGSVHRRARPVPVGDGALCRYRAAGDDLSRNRGFLPRLRHLLAAIRPRGGAAAGRGVVEFPAGAGAGAPHGADRPGVPHVRGRDCSANCSAAPQGRRRGSISRRCARAGRSACRAGGGQEFRTPSGKLEFYSEQLAAAGLRADAGLAARPGGGARRGALAAAPVDRARLFPGAHGLFRGRVPAPPRGAAVLHPAPGRGGAARPRRRRNRCGCSTSAARSVSC